MSRDELYLPRISSGGHPATLYFSSLCRVQLSRPPKLATVNHFRPLLLDQIGIERGSVGFSPTNVRERSNGALARAYPFMQFAAYSGALACGSRISFTTRFAIWSMSSETSMSSASRSCALTRPAVAGLGLPARISR